MNTKTTLIVAVIALLLGAYFLVFETDLFNRELATTREREQELAKEPPATGEALFAADAIAPEKVKTMRVQVGSEPAVVFVKQADTQGWVQTEPVRFDVQDRQVQDVIEAAAGLRQTGTVSIGSGEDAIAPADAGVNPPRAIVTLGGDEIQERTLVLGTRPGAGRAFVALGDPAKIDSAYIVGERLHDAVLSEPLRQWRSTTIASGILPGGADQVTLKAADGPAIVAKREDSRWMLTEPVKGRADRSAVEGLVNVLGGAVIDQFIADKPADLAAYGLAEPSRVLTVQVGEDQTHRLSIGAPADLERTKFFAMYNDVPVVFTLRQHDVERLDKTADDLRDPQITNVGPADISEITIQRAEQADLHLVRDQGKWTFGKPAPGFALEPQAIEQLLQAITTTKAADYGNPSGGAPLATVTLGISTRSEPEVLTVYDAAKEDRVMIVREGESTAYVVPRENLSMLFEPVIAYRERTVLDLAQDQIAELHIQRSGEHPAEYHITRSVPPEGEKLGQWNFKGFDAAAVKRLLESLTPLRAETWITPKPGESQDQVTVRVKLTDGIERVLMIDPVTRISRLDGQEQPFVIAQPLADLLASELRQRTVLSAGVEQIVSVQIGDLMIRRNDQGRFTASQGQINERKAAALWDALAGLQAEHFIDAARLTGEPTTTLTITAADNIKHNLRIWLSPEDPALAQLDDRAFTLNRDTAAALTAKPIGDM